MDQILGHDQPVASDEGFTCSLDALLTVAREGQVGCTGVLPVDRPLGFAVAHDEASGDHFGGLKSSIKDSLRSLEGTVGGGLGCKSVFRPFGDLRHIDRPFSRLSWIAGPRFY